MLGDEVADETTEAIETQNASVVGNYIEFDAGELRVTEGTPANFPTDASTETRAVQQLIVGLSGTNTA